MAEQAFPAGIQDDTARAVKLIRSFIRRQRPAANSDGGRTFYSPSEWALRKEEYGLQAVLIINHDGGGLAPYCDYARGDSGKLQRFAQFLQSHGFLLEQCTCWYSAVYKIVS